MSTWLKWRLIALMGFALVCSGGYWLHAQENYPVPAKTPQEASEKFMRLLVLVTDMDSNRPRITTVGGPRRQNALDDWPELEGSVSRRSTATLREGLPLLLQKLYSQSKTPQYNIHMVSGDENRAQVDVETVPVPKPLSLVLIAEDGGWRVDAIDTYAKLNHLEGDALTDSLIAVTGTIPQGFAPTRATRNALRVQCVNQLKQIALGIAQYTQDYDEKLPLARHWTDDLQPYIRNREIFTCPVLPVGKSNGYAYNQNLSRFSLGNVESPVELVGVYETTNLSLNVFGPGTARAYRHEDGMNCAFIDGHVKWTARTNAPLLKFKP